MKQEIKTNNLQEKLYENFPMVHIQKVKNNLFAYDARANIIMQVENSELQEIFLYHFDTVQEGTGFEYISKLKQSKIFLPNKLFKVVADDTELEDIINVHFNNFLPRKFTLEVTEDCTLRCSYCYFSDSISARKHSKTIMSQSTAFKAIDYYFDRYVSLVGKMPMDKREKLIKVAPPNLSWWGGEPLMNFDLIKKTQKYFSSKPWEEFGIGKSELIYSIVTNLTIYNTEIESFLISNNVYVFISIDGDKEENDRNRINKFGEGSFEVVMKNLDRLLSKHPSFCKKNVIIQSVLADNNNPSKTYKFINEKFISNGKFIILKHAAYPQKNRLRFVPNLYSNESYYKSLAEFEKRLSQLCALEEYELHKQLSSSLRLSEEFEDLLSFENAIHFDNANGSNEFSNLFSCPIGTDNIFISATGEFHMCNKSDYSMSIGNIENGINKNKIQSLYKAYLQVIREKCSSCWAFRFCNICPAYILDNKCFIPPSKKECDQIRKRVSFRMAKYIILLSNEELYDRISKYYNNQEVSFLTYKGQINIKTF